ncbi:MAG: hypothetical protein HZB71_14765 [Betaproteobacteria bacterium]|nr:hypothetical protein [Betaproteobacteria bacterium]
MSVRVLSLSLPRGLLLAAILATQPVWAAGPGAEFSWWSVSETTPGLYRLEFNRDALRVARQGNNPGGTQNGGLSLSLPRTVTEDFEARVAFSDARIEGGLNQIELQAGFADGSIFYAVRDREGRGSHVWTPGIRGDAPCGNNGVLILRRSQGLVTGLCDDVVIHYEQRPAALTSLRFVLQNNGGNDPVSVTFSDWRFNAAMTQPVYSGGGRSYTADRAPRGGRSYTSAPRAPTPPAPAATPAEPARSGEEGMIDGALKKLKDLFKF